jgi:PAS domain S-box-containing protein
MVERVPAVVYVDASDEQSSAIYMSPRAEGMLGYAPEEWLDDPGLWVKLLHEEDRQRVLAEQRRTRRTGEPFSVEYRLISKGGRTVWVRDEAVLVEEGVGGRPVWYGLLADVTEQRRADEALRESEERFRTTFEQAAVGMAHLAPDGRWLRINDKLYEIAGYPREELQGMTYLDLTPAEDLEAGRERLRRLLEGKRASYIVEKRYVRKDGRRVWVSLSVSLVRDASGEPNYLVCVAKDVTERKLSELVRDPLTDREMEVLRYLAEGLKNREIAGDLGYSVGMIKVHVERILRKLDVDERKQAAARAIEIGLIPPPPY